jgi:hypothetical protein
MTVREVAGGGGTVTAAVALSGPFFSGDPGQKMAENIERLMQEIADRGASDARRGFASGSGSRQLVRELGDRVADHIVGRVVARPSKGGRRWRAAGVVQVYNEGLSGLQGRSLMAAASILEGRQNVIRKVSRSMGQALRRIDLTRGLE